MALIRFEANPARSENGFKSVIYDLTGAAPVFPPRSVECRTWRECEAAFDAYTHDAAELGKCMALTMRVKEGRTPSGFRRLPWQRFVHA